MNASIRSLLFVVAGVVLVVRDSSAAPRCPSPNDETAVSGKEAEKRRILHLASGQAIRVPSRWAEDRWEYRNHERWQPLQPGQVVAAELETDVLAAWRAKQKELNARSLENRVRLASWAATSGLAQEALEMLDRVLADAPDQPDALVILRERWLMNVPSVEVASEALPSAIADLFRAGAGLPAAGREIAVIELEKLADHDALRADLARELRSPIGVRRSFAALALRRLFAGAELKPLYQHTIFDPSEDVRRACALALKATKEPGIIVPLVKTLDSSNVLVRMRAADALGEMGFAAAVQPLMARLAAGASEGGRVAHANIFIGRQIAYIQDFDVEVAQFQAVADPNVNVLIEGQSTDVGVIGSVEATFSEESQSLRRALGRLTQAQPGRSARDWLRWWDENAARWDAAAHSQSSTSSGEAR